MTILQEFRKENRLTQNETSDILGVPINTYRSYELGIRKIPTSVFITMLENWRTYPSRIKLIQVLKWELKERGK